MKIYINRYPVIRTGFTAQCVIMPFNSVITDFKQSAVKKERGKKNVFKYRSCDNFFISICMCDDSKTRCLIFVFVFLVPQWGNLNKDKIQLIYKFIRFQNRLECKKVLQTTDEVKNVYTLVAMKCGTCSSFFQCS